MRSCASLSARPQAGHDDLVHSHAQPTVWVDGVPESQLAVFEMRVQGPLDLRHVLLEAPIDVDAHGSCLLQRWLDAEVVVALPLRLVDGGVRWRVLAEGRLGVVQRAAQPGGDRLTLRLVDAWQAALQRRIEGIWWAGSEATVTVQRSGRLEPGPNGNRSRARHVIDGRSVHVLEADGRPWTVGTAVETLLAMAGLHAYLALLPREIREAPLLTPIDLAQPVGQSLEALCEAYGLVVRRELTWSGGRVLERVAWRSVRQGRPMRLRWGGQAGSLGDVIRIDSERPAQGAQQWIARASGWLIESTFNLVGGWAPALEGQADSDYDRADSHDFAMYANVYRYWVLNEDGYFSQAPFNREAFDLAEFFAVGGVQPHAQAWQACVTRSDAGEARPVIVQISTDQGASWSQYPGRVRLSSHRAAVYLDDDALPTDFLAAARLGEARVRVTASLRSPVPVQATRWRGNAFAGTQPPKVFQVERAFQFRRVHEDSIHFQDVHAGVLSADEQDQRVAMQAWLVDRMQEHARCRQPGDGRGRIELAGVRTELGLGDRLLDSPGVDTGNKAIGRHGAVVLGYDCRFTASRRSPATTTVHVRW